MTSYFEINGEIISCEDAEDLVSAAPPNLPNSVIDAAMELHEQEMKDMAFDEQYWPLLEEAERATGFTPVEVGQSLGRLRRATTAATWAGTLALADGPLPFGDALAAGVLAGYAAYELSLIYRDYRD